MALGADDKEAAGINYDALVGFDLILDFLNGALALRPFEQPGKFLLHTHIKIAAKLDVSAPARHVGGNGDGAGRAGLRDDLGFLLVIARVQDIVRNIGGCQRL